MSQDEIRFVFIYLFACAAYTKALCMFYLVTTQSFHSTGSVYCTNLPWYKLPTNSWESLLYNYLSEYRLHVCVCLLCLIYHLASALTMLLGGWADVLCVCVSSTVQQAGWGLTEQIAWLLKRC